MRAHKHYSVYRRCSMKRTDAVSLIAIYHFVMSIPFLIGSFVLVFAVVPVLINVESGEVIWPLFGIGIGKPLATRISEGEFDGAGTVAIGLSPSAARAE